MQKNKGIYTLILELSSEKTIPTGKLGRVHYPVGYYAYTGSARSKSGFSRIHRHVNVAGGINKTRHWHIDYLLGHAAIKAIITTTTEKNLECIISDQIKTTTTSVYNFGSTDCKCKSHLQYHPDMLSLLKNTFNAYHAHTNNINLLLLT